MITKEKDIQIFWKKLKSGTILLSADGEKIEILSPGSWNFEEGPDFLDAKFAIDGKKHRGDVEIHIRTSDWLDHKHSEDPKYANVKLHAVIENDLKHSPSHAIVAILPEKAKSAKIKVSQNTKFGTGKCKKIFSSLSDDTIYNLFCEAGIERFKEKASSATAEIIALGFDNALLRRIFEALGYKKNKNNFLELFDRLSTHRDFSDEKILPALIWGESALLPDPTTQNVHPEMKELASKYWSIWWKHRDGNTELIKWVKSGVRPLNSPERRIAGLCSILSKTTTNIFAKIAKIKNESPSPEKFAEGLIQLFTASDPVWNSWTNFKDKRSISAAVIGEMRSLDIVMNVVLPFLFAKFAIEKNEPSSDFCLETYQKLPRPQDNVKIKIAANKWFEPPSRIDVIVRDTASAQGTIYLLKKFCEVNSSYCPECLLLKKLNPEI